MKRKRTTNKRYWLGILLMALAFTVTLVGCDDDKKEATIIIKRIGPYGCSNVILHNVITENQYQVTLGDNQLIETSCNVPPGKYYVTGIGYSSGGKTVRSSDFDVKEGATKVISYYQSNYNNNFNGEFRL